MRRTLKSNMQAYLFIFPAFFLIAVFTLIPLVEGFFLGFFSWDMVTSAPRFVGMRNYNDILGDSEIYESFRRTILYALMLIPLSMIFGLFLALLLTGKSKVNVVYRTIFFSPMVTSMVAMSAVWLYIYHPSYGPINQLLHYFGITPVRWLNDRATALPSLGIMAVWKQLGFCTVIYLAAIQNISKEVIEAAMVDGASALQRIFLIEIPLVSPATFLLVILLTIESFQVFTQINVMTQGGPAESTQNVLVMLFRYAFERFQMGFASAIGVLLFLSVLGINLIQLSFERKVHYD